MSLAQAIFMSAFVLAIAIVMSSYAPVVAQGRAGYMVANGNGQFVWRVNTVDGSLTYCARFDNNTNESQLKGREPYCSKPGYPNH